MEDCTPRQQCSMSLLTLSAVPSSAFPALCIPSYHLPGQFTVVPLALLPRRANPSSLANRYVAFLTGKAVISLPNSPQTATIRGGKNGLIFAADTDAVSKLGHTTRYPSEQETIGLSIRTAGGVVPPHTVLYDGPCRGQARVK